jgi:predicted RNA-binding Zn ribbon-like protein
MIGYTVSPTAEVRRVQDFVNTLDLESGIDEVRSWVVQRGVPRPTRRQLERARSVREALRALLLANNGADADVASAETTLDEAARRARLRLQFEGGVRLEPTSRGLDGALGGVVADVAAAVAEGRFSRLKACRAPDCHWAFYDRARNRSRAWCSMAVCGNRAKARTYRRRTATR